MTLRSKTPTGPKGVGPLAEENEDVDNGLGKSVE